MRERFMQTVEEADPRVAFEAVKTQYGVKQYMRVPYPDETDPYHGSIRLTANTLVWDILSWDVHLNPAAPQMKSSHAYQEKVNYWYSAEYRQWLTKAFERLYHSPGVCGVVQGRDLDTGEVLDKWTFFGWYDVVSVVLPAKMA